MQLQLGGPVDAQVMWDAEWPNLPDALREIATMENLTAFIGQCHAMGVQAGNRMVGGVLLEKNSYFHIAFLPEFHGKWAPQLYPDVLRWIFSHTDIAHASQVLSNTQAINFFKKHGWTRLDNQKHPVLGIEMTCFVMTREDADQYLLKNSLPGLS